MRARRSAAKRHRDEGWHSRLLCRGADRLWIDHLLITRVIAVHSSDTGRSMCRIAVGLVQAQAMLPEPAMQDIGIHAMFTGRGSDGCAGLQARGDQIGLELRAVDPACAGDRVAR